MIDFYRTKFACALGAEELAALPNRDSLSPTAKGQKLTITHPNWAGAQKAIITPETVTLMVCPQKVLGSWNACGTNDLQEAVKMTAPKVLRGLGIKDIRIEESIRQGSYGVEGVHIAEQFYLHDREIDEFLIRMYEKMNRGYKAEWINRGVGFRIRSRSRTASYHIYSKWHQVEPGERKGVPRKDVLAMLRNRFEKLGEGNTLSHIFLQMEIANQLEAAMAGPRLEIRFGDHFFSKKNPLSLGENWTVDSAAKIYKQYLAKLKLPRKVLALRGRKNALEILPGTTVPTYLLWANGEDMDKIGTSRKTFSRHRTTIQDKLGVDIALPASMVLGNRRTVDPGRVIRWANRAVFE